MNFTAQTNHFLNRGFETELHIPKLVTFLFEVADELSCFDSDIRLCVESPNDGRNVEAMYFGEFARAEPMITISSGPMMTITQRNSRFVGGLLPQSVRSGLRGLYAPLDSADNTG